MNAERWQRIEVLFDQAMDRPDAERGSVLEQDCAGDPELHRELAAMLASAPTAGSSLRRAVAAEVRLLASAGAATQAGRPIGRFRVLELLGSTAARPVTGSVDPPGPPAAAIRAPSTAALTVSSTAVSPAPPSPPPSHRPAIVDDENPLLTPPPYRALAASPYRGPAPVAASPSSVMRASSGATHPPSGSTYRGPAPTGTPPPWVYRTSGGAADPPSGAWYRVPATATPSSHSTPWYHPPAPSYHPPAPSYHPPPTYHR